MKILEEDFSGSEVYKSDMEIALEMVDIEEKVEYKVERKSGSEGLMNDMLQIRSRLEQKQWP